jgi:hypothetical protein
MGSFDGSASGRQKSRLSWALWAGSVSEGVENDPLGMSCSAQAQACMRIPVVQASKKRGYTQSLKVSDWSVELPVRATITSLFEQVAREQQRELSPLSNPSGSLTASGVPPSGSLHGGPIDLAALVALRASVGGWSRCAGVASSFSPRTN